MQQTTISHDVAKGETPSAMKIAFVMRWASGGGAERVMTTLANQLVLRGYHVDFVFISAQGVFLKTLQEGVNVVDLAAKRTLYAPYKLYHYLKQNRSDIVVSALNYINVMVVMACRMLAKPLRPKIILTEHGTLSTVLKDLKGTGKIVPMLMRHSYPYADKIITVSDGVAQDLQQYLSLPKQTVQTIYNPIDFDHIHHLAQQPLLHEWAQQSQPIILGVGRLVEVKNFPLLIQAFNIVRAKLACRLVILGEGKQRDLLTQLIYQSPFAQDIALLGFCDNPYPWLARADVFVLSSKTEGLPTVLIEALWCGANVVSTDCPFGPREILQDGLWGKLVEVDDATAMAEAVIQQLTSASEHLKDHERLTVQLRQRFGLMSICQQYEHVFLQLCPQYVATKQ